MSRIVKDTFFCMYEKKTYNKGEKYNGNRKDLEHRLEPVKKKTTKQKAETKKGAIEKKSK